MHDFLNVGMVERSLERMGKIASSLFVAICLAAGNDIGISSADEGAGHPAFNMAAADTHWAFIPLQKPEVPSIDVVRGNEVDAFILKRLQERGLKPNGPADKRSLIRRVTYDLTGLPPTFEEVQSFVADDSPGSYEKLVDRLLASSAHGERWARHWLDVARYADTKGRPNFRDGNRYAYAHTYRDYVIEAFNEDKPFDRFILEQMAADHLDLGEDNRDLAALGFLTLGRVFAKDNFIDDQIDAITRGLQGLTVTCARCHDHKFDPIPTSDYYSLHGVFNSTEIPEKLEELPVIRHPEKEEDYVSYLAEVARIQKRIDDRADEVIAGWLLNERLHAGNFLDSYEEAKTIPDDLSVTGEFTVFAGINHVSPRILQLWIDYLETEDGRSHPVLKDWFEKYANSDREAGIKYYNQLFTDALDEELDDERLDVAREFLTEEGSPLNPDLEVVKIWIRRKIEEPQNAGDIMKERDAVEWTHPGAPIRAHIISDVTEPKDSPIYMRGNVATPGDVVPRQFLQIISKGARKPYSIGSGRLEFAQDLTSKENPLTARVFVNRVWGWHMGQEFVNTPSDFGVRTPEPEQIDLLNWLSATFIESEWSIKALHRKIVLSNTYQQSSTPNPESLAADSENTLWHHFPKARLGFEPMRDTLLAVSGNLDRTMGGVQEDIMDPMSNRRTVYSFLDRSEPPGIFRTFDHPSPAATSPKRFETIVPQQALFLMNSPFTITQAKFLADRIEREAEDNAESRIGGYYRAVYQREATDEELQTGLEFIDNFDALDRERSSDPDAGEWLNEWELYAQALLLSNELIFVD
jgi:hypothetical protein